MSIPRISACHCALLVLAFAVGGALAAPSALAEMYKYVDSAGRMHFTQDIGQVPPQYRSQVERKVLKKDISITGEGGAQGSGDRVQQMENRKRRLERAAQNRSRRHASPAAARKRGDPLTGAKEPRKYDKDCTNYYRTGRCRKTLTSAWQRWNQANGGNNGKATVRRKIGDR